MIDLRIFLSLMVSLPLVIHVLYGPLLYLKEAPLTVEEKTVRVHITIKWTDQVLGKRGSEPVGTASNQQELEEVFHTVEALKNRYEHLGYSFRTEYHIE